MEPLEMSGWVLAELERRRTHRVDGHATMWGLLRSVVGWSDRECRERMRIARVVDRFSGAGELFFDARVPVANLAEIGRGFANPRCGDQIVDVIGTLINEAARMEFDDFKVVVRRWELLADTEGAHRDAQTNHESRTAHCTVWDGVGHLEAQWGEADGLANREIFDRFVETEWRADWDATVAAHGDQASVLLMPRTPGQRRADALSAIFQAAAAAAPGARRPEPVLNVFVDHPTFTDLLIEADLLPERFVDPFEAAEPVVTERRCQSEHGDPIDPQTAMQIALEGLPSRVAGSPHGAATPTTSPGGAISAAPSPTTATPSAGVTTCSAITATPPAATATGSGTPTVPTAPRSPERRR